MITKQAFGSTLFGMTEILKADKEVLLTLWMADKVLDVLDGEKNWRRKH